MLNARNHWKVAGNTDEQAAVLVSSHPDHID
jgi:hypothetical protein